MNHGMMRYNQTEKKAENASERAGSSDGGLKRDGGMFSHVKLKLRHEGTLSKNESTEHGLLSATHLGSQDLSISIMKPVTNQFRHNLISPRRPSEP
jgi:hypothetical protein